MCLVSACASRANVIVQRREVAEKSKSRHDAASAHTPVQCGRGRLGSIDAGVPHLPPELTTADADFVGSGAGKTGEPITLLITSRICALTTGLRHCLPPSPPPVVTVATATCYRRSTGRPANIGVPRKNPISGCIVGGRAKSAEHVSRPLLQIIPPEVAELVTDEVWDPSERLYRLAVPSFEHHDELHFCICFLSLFSILSACLLLSFESVLMGNDLACRLPSINLLSLDLPLPTPQYYPVYYDQYVPRQPLLFGALLQPLVHVPLQGSEVAPPVVGGSFVAPPAATRQLSVAATLAPAPVLPHVANITARTGARALPEAPSGGTAAFLAGLTSLAAAASANDALAAHSHYLHQSQLQTSLLQDSHLHANHLQPNQLQNHLQPHHSDHLHPDDDILHKRSRLTSNSVSEASSAVSLPSTSALSVDLAGHDMSHDHPGDDAKPSKQKAHEKDWKPRKKRQCPECHLFFSNLATHKSTHLKPTSRPHVCKLCHRGFARPNDLFRHFKCHWKEMGADNGQYRCPFKNGPHGDHCCHTLGIFSRCDTYKNHLKAIHFQYPSGTKKSQRNQVPGNCRLCHAQFRNVDEWIATHIDANQCPYGTK